jgi:hypothetical protein
MGRGPPSKPFVKGYDPRRIGSGPRIRRRGWRAVRDMLREMGEQVIDEANDITLMDAVCQRLYGLALEGNMDAMRELFNRTDGKVKESLEIQLAEKKPVHELTLEEIQAELAAGGHNSDEPEGPIMEGELVDDGPEA